MGEGFFALAPEVTFLLAVEALAIVVFTDLCGLPEANQEPIILPGLQGVSIIKEGREDDIGQWCPPLLVGHQAEWGKQYTCHSFYRLVIVGESILPALMEHLV